MSNRDVRELAELWRIVAQETYPHDNPEYAVCILRIDPSTLNTCPSHAVPLIDYYIENGNAIEVVMIHPDEATPCDVCDLEFDLVSIH